MQGVLARQLMNGFPRHLPRNKFHNLGSRNDNGFASCGIATGTFGALLKSFRNGFLRPPSNTPFLDAAIEAISEKDGVRFGTRVLRVASEKAKRKRRSSPQRSECCWILDRRPTTTTEQKPLTVSRSLWGWPSRSFRFPCLQCTTNEKRITISVTSDWSEIR